MKIIIFVEIIAMDMRKKTLILASALFFAGMFSASAQTNPSGTLTYSLPQTVLTFEVDAVQESFYAGPYAKYAEKYLGVVARQQDDVKTYLSSVKMNVRTEADQTKRYTVTIPKDAADRFLSLTSQGLISASQGGVTQQCEWRFPAPTDADFSHKGISSAYTTTATSLTRGSSADSVFNRTSVSQNIVVTKSVDQKAKEAADMILSLRKTRVQIVTGDTDANYSGESMGAALAEIDRLESEYLTLFLGYSDYQHQTMNYDVVPVNNSRNNVFVAFRIADAQGLVAADDITGRPYFIDVVPEAIDDSGSVKAAKATKLDIHYMIPAVCTVKLSDGESIIFQTRVPIHQFGIENIIPVK